jgi:hypothetical protein
VVMAHHGDREISPPMIVDAVRPKFERQLRLITEL